MRTTRVLPLVLASVATLAVTGCGSDFKRDEPQTAVRDFLTNSLARANGQQACDWLTQDAQKAFAEPADTLDSGQSCRRAMERAFLIGDKDQEEVDTVQDVNDLDYSATKDGEEATVTVKGDGGATLTVELGRSEGQGLGNLYEPESPWRITGGLEPLVNPRS